MAVTLSSGETVASTVMLSSTGTGTKAETLSSIRVVAVTLFSAGTVTMAETLSSAGTGMMVETLSISKYLSVCGTESTTGDASTDIVVVTFVQSSLSTMTTNWWCDGAPYLLMHPCSLHHIWHLDIWRKKSIKTRHCFHYMTTVTFHGGEKVSGKVLVTSIVAFTYEREEL